MASITARTKPARQLTIFTRGGARPGAGRKPNGARPLVPHTKRARLSRDSVVHVTTRIVAGRPSLRSARAYRLVECALAAAKERLGLRIVHHSIQTNHVHLIVETEHARALGRGMKGFLVRLARALNRSWAREGRVFADRFHAAVLTTPRQVRNALVYVLQNARKHGIALVGFDPCSSAARFDGWAHVRAGEVARVWPKHARARGTPKSWLLRVGWRRHGRIHVGEVPLAARRRVGCARNG